MGNDVIDGELIEDSNGKWLWRTANGRLVPVEMMADNHLRNAAMFLMGLGYAKCIAADNNRIVWLRIFRLEWERRMFLRAKGRKAVLELIERHDEVLEELDGTSSGFASRLLED